MKLYITTDSIGIQSGGGAVTKNEMDAIKSLGDDVVSIDANDINSTNIGLPDIPFLHDYLAMERVTHLGTTKIDMVHFYSGCFTNTIRYLKCRNIKVTYTIDAHNREESIKEFQNLGYHYPYIHVKDDFLWNIYLAGELLADVIITPSKLSENILRNQGCKNIAIIPHGCNIPNNVGPIPEKFNVGYLGQSGPDKGLAYLIQSWSDLNYNDSTLILAGNGTENLAPFIQKYANGGKYHTMGFINDTAELYNNISVYIQPSVTEAWGMEVIEAMSHGRPVIVSEGAGVADAVENGINGFIVPKRDRRSIADKITWFRDNPKELKEMGENAKEKAKTYSWDNIKQLYINLWKSI